jgi:hypothetical protein
MANEETGCLRGNTDLTRSFATTKGTSMAELPKIRQATHLSIHNDSTSCRARQLQFRCPWFPRAIKIERSIRAATRLVPLALTLVMLCTPCAILLASAQDTQKPASAALQDTPQASSAAHDSSVSPLSPKGTTPPKKEEKTDLSAKEKVQVGIIVVAMAVLVGVVTALLTHLSAFRTQLSSHSANDPEFKKLFFQMALGVPDGTIRSALAILIVLGALVALMAGIGKDLQLEVPGALSGIFGTILGFYFGRTGSVETAQASAAVAGAAHSNAQAAQAVSAAKQQAAQSDAAMKTMQDDQAAVLSARADAALSVMSAIAAAIPPPLDPSVQSSLIASRDSLTSANQSANVDDLKAAYARLIDQGPLATLVRAALPNLSTLAGAGTSPIDATRALVALSARLSPAVAQIWVARILRQPYHAELYSPVIDDAYATSLVAQVPAAAMLQAKLKTVIPTLTNTEFVSMVVAEDAAAQLAERSSGLISVEDAAPVVDAMQQRSIEFELRKSLTNEDAKPFGDLTALFSNLDKIQSDPSGLRGLDTLMLIVREARKAAVPAIDLLPSV